VPKEPQQLRIQHRIKETPLASIVDGRVIMLIIIAIVDVNHPPQLQEHLHRQTAMEALPRPSSTELCSRKSKPSGCGGSSERPNHGARYIIHQFYSLLTISCFLFFFAPKNLGARFLLRVVILSHPKI
jgi:hypothetical protein